MLDGKGGEWCVVNSELQGGAWDSVRATHGYPEEVSCGRRALGEGGIRTDSLIVVVNR
jgi:hypothetical protein